MSLCVITPAFNEADNLPVLYRGLRAAADRFHIDWNWLVVDDHSGDATFDEARKLAVADQRVRAIRLARNVGSHVALRCGLDHCDAECAVVLAADMQDPPEVIPTLLEKWRAGAQMVWAVRARREGEKTSTLGFARLYYGLMRQVVGVKGIPATGADFFLLDRKVIEAVRRFPESNVSLLALLVWLGFRQESVLYVKQPRLHGRSGWSWGKKIKLVIDSVTAFTYLPIRCMSVVGVVVALIGFVYALVVLINGLLGHPTSGWTSLMIAVLVIGGIQMTMMGVLGEYVWRALDEARRRPRYIIEAAVGRHADALLPPTVPRDSGPGGPGADTET
jgi:dolichol-phosphate mannosyltransferase